MPAPYRDDDDALEARLRSLTDQLEAGQARARELRDIEHREGKLEKEVADLRRELQRRASRRQAAAERAARPPRFGRRAALSAVGGSLVAAGAWALYRPSAPGVALPQVPATGAPSASPPVVDPLLLERLAAGAVYHDHFQRGVLYTWTTAEQAEELQRTRLLLTKTRSATKGQSFFDRRREVTPSSVAKMFGEPALARRRFAWSSPWPTVRGIGEAETYGDRLIRVTLERRAILAYFGGTDAAWWQFFDLEGRPVPFQQVTQHPERIAGVFHVYEGEEGHGPYRELVLCNESMIEEWALDAPEIHAEIAASIDLLGWLRAAIERDPPDLAAMEAGAASVAREVWARRAGAPSLAALYEANLAFPGKRYRLDLETLDAIVATLRAVPRGPEIRHRPDLRFPGFSEGASARGSGPTYGAGNALPSTLPPGWRHPVKCIPQGSFGCTPLLTRGALVRLLTRAVPHARGAGVE